MDHAWSKNLNRKSFLNTRASDRSKSNDTKNSKENLRISELLLRAKINSSFRIKGPKASNVSNENILENFNQSKERCDGLCSYACKNNSDDENNVAIDEPNADDYREQKQSPSEDDKLVDTIAPISDTNGTEDTKCTAYDRVYINQAEQLQEKVDNNENGANVLDNVTKNRATLQKMASFTESHTESYINRKLSFDFNMTRRRESLSKSEMDLNQVGKIPLQRKTSFFRKNFNSFVKNTSEVFRRQSERISGERKHTNSYSLQSLNDKNTLADASRKCQELKKNFNGSASSLDRNSGNGSLCSLNEDQPTSNFSEGSSIKSLNELYFNETMMAGRAFSVSSGLDTVRSQRHSPGMAHRSNRYTWLASDSVAEYMRRRVEDEMARRQEGGSVSPAQGPSDGTARADPNKGRRLSYECAVSRPAGEDLALPARVTDSLRRRLKIIDGSEDGPSSPINADLATRLYDYSTKGVPALKGYELPNISDQAYNYIYWVDANGLNTAFVLDGELTPEEEARQEVVKELVATEADYIRHLVAVVQVFIAAAHDLQENGRMLSIATEKLFSNLPDVLNANLCFWDSSLYPMLIDSLQNRSKFNVEYLHLGFSRFHDLFQPYERYLSDQSKMQDYLRSLDNDVDFHTYITWCESHRHCNRLKLADILVKPMQRLMKYSLMLRRIINHTENEQEKMLLYTMDNCAKSYVQNLNRTIKKRQDNQHLESLIDSLDIYELDCKDDEMDRMFRLHSNLNLKHPMTGCLLHQRRSVVYEGDLRFKDNKEQKIDGRVVLLTDMLLICKKIGSKISGYYKIIRPKFMVDKLLHYLQFKTGKTGRELHSIIFVALDETMSAYHCFSITDSVKETCSQTLRNWDLKFREAKLTMELSKMMTNHPNKDPYEINIETVANHSWRQGECSPNDLIHIEREAKERVSMMLHKPISAHTTELHSQSSIGADSSEVTESLGSLSKSSSAHLAYGRSAWSARSSRAPSLQHSCSSNDGASSDGVNLGASASGQTTKLPTAVQVHLPPYNEVASITVQISNDETEQKAPEFAENLCSARAQYSPNSNTFKRNTLNVHPQCGVMALVHSLPDLTLEPSTPRTVVTNYPTNFGSMTVSERIYFVHQEKLNRFKLAANRNISSQGNFTLLSADNRGTSYPPPTPQRASLKRGVAFSHPMKNPPLAKMGHVNSQSTGTHLDPNPVHSGFQRSTDHNDQTMERGTINSVLVYGRQNKFGKSSPAHSTDRASKVNP